jgi:hypothetical protein
MEWEMGQVSQLASAGLAIVLAAVLVTFSYLFLAAQSARHPATTASDAFALRPSQVAFYQARGF